MVLLQPLGPLHCLLAEGAEPGEARADITRGCSRLAFTALIGAPNALTYKLLVKLRIADCGAEEVTVDR
jgi:hypothetical protein